MNNYERLRELNLQLQITKQQVVDGYDYELVVKAIEREIAELEVWRQKQIRHAEWCAKQREKAKAEKVEKPKMPRYICNEEGKRIAKYCNRCCEYRPLFMFYVRVDKDKGTTYYQPWCKICYTLKRRGSVKDEVCNW